MTTFSQVYDDTAHNVVVGDDFRLATADKYVPEWIDNEISSGRPWTEVPDTDKDGAPLKHGATLADGVWANPPAPVVHQVPAALNKAQFQALYAANDSDLSATLSAWPMVAG